MTEDFLLQSVKEPNKVIEDYVNKNQSNLRSLLRDISARRVGRGGLSEIRNKNNNSLPQSYIKKSYGNRSNSIGLSAAGVSSHLQADGGQKAAPFTPYLGTPAASISREKGVNKIEISDQSYPIIRQGVPHQATSYRNNYNCDSGIEL